MVGSSKKGINVKKLDWVAPLSTMVGLAVIVAFAKWPPNGSAAWASWVQAVGSIGAIIGAFSVARYQADKNFRLQTEASVNRRQRLAGVAVLQIATLVETMNYLVSFTERKKFASADYRVYGEQMRQHAKTLAALPLEDFDPDKAVALLSVKAIVDHITVALSKMERDELTDKRLELFIAMMKSYAVQIATQKDILNKGEGQH